MLFIFVRLFSSKYQVISSKMEGTVKSFINGGLVYGPSNVPFDKQDVIAPLEKLKEILKDGKVGIRIVQTR